jgi:heme oxygenase (biliverdin-producing, ferredoxin)
MPNFAVADAPVSVRVREHTAAAHRRAETRVFITALMGGELDLAAYARYLAALAPVYAAIEARAPQPSDPAILDPRLARLDAIEHDLAALGVAPWREQRLPDASTRYAEHLAAIETRELPRYLAHHYTRYLGDLSGGQAIGALMSRHYGATPDQLTFFDFRALGSPVAFKRSYRDGLDALPFDERDAQAFVDEAALAFEHNEAIFDELRG